MLQWDKFSKKISNAAKSASKKSERMVETAKLNAAISRLELEIEDLQYELGKAYYEEYSNAKDAEFQTYINQINDISLQIQDYNRKLLAFKGLQICSSCESTEPLHNEFCGKCGARLEGYPLRNYNCEHCGAALKKNDAFCTECGTPTSFEESEDQFNATESELEQYDD